MEKSGEAGGGGELRLEGLEGFEGLGEERERRDARVRKRRGAAEEEEERGEAGEEEAAAAEEDEEEEEERSEVAGSRWVCRWRRFESINISESSMSSTQTRHGREKGEEIQTSGLKN